MKSPRAGPFEDTRRPACGSGLVRSATCLDMKDSLMRLSFLFVQASALLMTLAQAAPALAHHKPGHAQPGRGPVAVPEIDASSGLLAIAAVGCLLLLVWERRRRRAKGQGAKTAP